MCQVNGGTSVHKARLNLMATLFPPPSQEFDGLAFWHAVLPFSETDLPAKDPLVLFTCP